MVGSGGHVPRVVVADDSALMRRLLADALGAAGFDVVAVAHDGDSALAACREHTPDVLTLDLAMPGVDGIGVLRGLRETGSPVRVVVVSAFSPTHAATAVDALAEGAFELVAKPGFGEPLDAFASELGRKVGAAAHSGRVRGPSARPTARRPEHPPVRRPAAAAGRKLVVIACSTGGPRALAELVPALTSPLGAGTVIVQHMPPGFTRSLAERLDRLSELNVCEADGQRALEPATALVAPGGRHLRLRADGAIELSDAPAIGGLRPRADLTIKDAAAAFGADLLLVVLTGMGKDGLDGAREVKRRGGRVLAEAESSCTVYGMPRAVVEAGLADGVHDLSRLADAIAAEAGR